MAGSPIFFSARVEGLASLTLRFDSEPAAGYEQDLPLRFVELCRHG